MFLTGFGYIYTLQKRRIEGSDRTKKIKEEEGRSEGKSEQAARARKGMDIGERGS